MRNKNRIVRVWIERAADESPDTSYLGTYTDEVSDNAIVRATGERIGDMGEDPDLPERGREYRFFLPAMTGDETGNPDSPRQDWQRMEALERGDWRYIGIIAKAEIVVSGVSQTVRSGGLWGIESDSDERYCSEVAAEELAELRKILASLGFGKAAIARAFRSVKTEEK